MLNFHLVIFCIFKILSASSINDIDKSFFDMQTAINFICFSRIWLLHCAIWSF
jgi:hypothetical protein